MDLSKFVPLLMTKETPLKQTALSISKEQRAWVHLTFPCIDSTKEEKRTGFACHSESSLSLQNLMLKASLAFLLVQKYLRQKHHWNSNHGCSFHTHLTEGWLYTRCVTQYAASWRLMTQLAQMPVLREYPVNVICCSMWERGHSHAEKVYRPRKELSSYFEVNTLKQYNEGFPVGMISLKA